MTLNAYPVPGTIFLSDFNILSSFKKKNHSQFDYSSHNSVLNDIFMIYILNMQ